MIPFQIASATVAAAAAAAEEEEAAVASYDADQYADARNDALSSFFDHYFSTTRFSVETVMAALATVANLLVIRAIRRIRREGVIICIGFVKVQVWR